jgi:hypothetical protein
MGFSSLKYTYCPHHPEALVDLHGNEFCAPVVSMTCGQACFNYDDSATIWRYPMPSEQQASVDYSGSILICKRPGIDLDHHQVEKTNTVLAKCADCQTDVFVMKKNLGRGLTLLCAPCATKRVEDAGKPTVILGGEVIGSEHEAEIHRIAADIEDQAKGKP